MVKIPKITAFAKDPETFRTLKVSYDDEKKILSVKLWPVHINEIKDHRNILLLDICHRLITNVKKNILGG